MRDRMNPLGRHLRAARARSGLTQQQLARRASVNTATVVAIEAGRSKHPHATTVCRLAEALGMSVESLEGSGAAPADSAAPPSIRGDTTPARANGPVDRVSESQAASSSSQGFRAAAGDQAPAGESRPGAILSGAPGSDAPTG